MNSSLYRQIVITVALALCAASGKTQRFNFVNLGVENGLIQSQVNSITQDQDGMLWMGTLGGLNRYDGWEFSAFNKINGLLNSFIFKVHADTKNKIWIGTQTGIQCFDGKNYTTYPVLNSPPTNSIFAIAEARGNIIYFITRENKLYRIQENMARQVVIDDSANFITAIQEDRRGVLHAIVYNKGIYTLTGSKWTQVINFPQQAQPFYFSRIFFGKNNEPWLLSTRGAFRITDKILYPVALSSGTAPNCLSINQDKLGDTWIGTMKGVYKISPHDVVSYIGAQNGLTDNAIYDIYPDREDNLWLASDGNGVYKYADNSFSFLDKTTGLQGEVIMGLAQNKSGTWIGTAENGLSKYNGQTFQHLRIASDNPQAQKINSLLMDSKGTLWLGTIGGGLWQYANGRFSSVEKKHPIAPADISTLYEDNDGNIWITSPQGCYFYADGKLQKVKGLNIPCFSVYQLSRDSILIGTTDGIRLLTGKTSLSSYPISGTENTTIGQLRIWKNYLVVATFEKGLLLYDRVYKTVQRCTEQSGLSSDILFSLLIDGDIMYTGTVNGVNKVLFDEETKQFQVTILHPSDHLLGPECNQNAILKDSSGKIWVGTTKGILIYDPETIRAKDHLPLIYLDGIQLFSKNIAIASSIDTLIAWKNIPRHLVLKPAQNHLTFQLKGVYLTNPAALRYQFMLEGADTAFSAPVASSMVIYSNLAPGKYVFKAKALVENGLSSGILAYPFEIKPPFYKTVWFQLLAVLFLVSAGALYQCLRMKTKAKRNEALDKVRRDEQLRIQQKTSEDLHDDLGNKITRIALLTDILQSKTGADNEENKRIIRQIKENAQALYTGTKDIIWALNPEASSLQDFFQRIKSFGSELFDDTAVEFICSVNDDLYRDIHLPLDYNRNMIMILKEALNNILKHAAGSQAEIKISSDILSPRERNTLVLEISIEDNGRGMALNNQKKGYGLDNMRKRLERIDGSLTITGNRPTGTVLLITVNIPLKEGYGN